MGIKNSKGLSIAFTIVGGVVTAAIPYMTIKNHKKAEKDISKLREANKDLSKKDNIQIIFKDYWPTMLLVTGSIGLNVASALLGMKREASLIATVTALDTMYKKYGDKVKEKFGIEADRQIISEIAESEFRENIKKLSPKQLNGNSLFYERHIGYFVANEMKVREALYKISLNMTDNNVLSYSSGIYTLNDFLNDCEGCPVKKKTETELNFGWSFDYLNESWNNLVIHHYIEKCVDEDATSSWDYFELYFDEEPVWSPGEWYECTVTKNIKPEEYLENIPEEFEQEEKEKVKNYVGN